jgi:NAD(P)-dependent dehydrogenase (short-subunit alcohol dehydrogenase family)
MNTAMQTQFDFSDKVAVVTGASGAIGMAIARRFHQAGAHVVATGRREDALAGLAAQLGERCELVIGDLADATHRSDILACAARLGGADLLINNAGMTQTKMPTLEASLEDFDSIVGVNLRATWALSLDVIRDWIGRGHQGAIVNVSSPGAQRAHRNNAIYDMTKGGVDALTRCLAADFGSHGIRVNAIAPAQILAIAAPWRSGRSRAACVVPRIRRRVVYYWACTAGGRRPARPAPHAGMTRRCDM